MEEVKKVEKVKEKKLTTGGFVCVELLTHILLHMLVVTEPLPNLLQDFG